jgi:hypothetical protein
MISFYDIGFMGGLGNQMFQYAGLKGIAAHKNYQYSLSTSHFELLDCFNIPQTPPSSNKKTIYSNQCEFNSDLFNNCPDDVNLQGYFQSEKYFKHIEHEIRKDFTFKDWIQETTTDYFNKKNIKECISLHIRRQDYLTSGADYFANLDLKYYEKGLSFFEKDIPVIIFSDDLRWCNSQPLFKTSRYIVYNLGNEFLDLCAMSMCNYHIIANSTYSWWGAWLAKSQKTVAPKHWFTGNFKDLNTKDLYLSNWITI